MFKIRKEKAPVTNVAHIAGSMSHAADAARENLTWMMAGIAAAVIVAIAVGGYFWLRQHENAAAEELLHQGMTMLSQASPAAPPPRPDQMQQAVETFRKVIAEYPRSSAAPQAAYMLGNVLSDLKDWEGATKAYQDFNSRYGGHTSLVPLVYQRLAYAQLSQGKLDEAQKNFEMITKISTAPNKDHALYELARIHEALQRPEGALAYYQELIKDHPHSPYTEEATIRIKTLDAKRTAPVPGVPPQQMPAAEDVLPKK
jgi:outer membrane protein assembly factor BamD (BamD/ComL family)